MVEARSMQGSANPTDFPARVPPVLYDTLSSALHGGVTVSLVPTAPLSQGQQNHGDSSAKQLRINCSGCAHPACSGTAGSGAIPSWKRVRGGHRRAPSAGSAQQRESGAWREEEDVGRLQIRSDRASKERLFLGPALEAQRGLETLKMLLYSECGYLAAAKSLFVHQVHGLIQNEKPTQGNQI